MANIYTRPMATTEEYLARYATALGEIAACVDGADAEGAKLTPERVLKKIRAILLDLRRAEDDRREIFETIELPGGQRGGRDRSGSQLARDTLPAGRAARDE